jgi:predicted dithiol-disulfide oxidoreductase (DUF899 family)
VTDVLQQRNVFEGPDGEVRLLDIFDGRSQLYIHHFMWIDDKDGALPAARRRRT